MIRWSRLLGGLGILAAFTVVGAQPKSAATIDERAPSGILYSQQEAKRTAFRCNFIDDGGGTAFKPTNIIECSFDVVAIWPHADPAEAARKAAADFDEGHQTASDKKEMLTKVRTLCAAQASPQWKAEEAHELARVGAHPRASWYLPSLQSEQSDLQAMCACSSIDCLREAIVQQSRHAEVCTIATNSWRDRFHRNGRGGWVSVEENSPCYSTITSALVPATDSSGFWEMRITRVPRPDPAPSCANAKIVDERFTWRRFGKYVQPDCKGFDFF